MSRPLTASQLRAFAAAFDGPDDGACPDCGTRWVFVTGQGGYRQHTDGCRYLSWMQDALVGMSTAVR